MLVRGATFVGVCQRLTTKILIPHACRPLCSKFTPLPNTGPKITKRESNEENVTKDQTAMEHQPVQFRPSDEFYNAQTDEVKVKLDKLIKQIELLAYVHDRIPSEIGDRDWSRLLTIRTTNGIISHLNYMLINEKKKANDRLKKEARRSKEHKEAKERVIEDMEEREARGEIVYSLSKNNMLLRMSRLRQSITENAKLASMLRLGATPTLLVDCDFLPKLSDKALGRTGVQMQYLLSENLSHVEPWNIDFVNFNRDTERMRDFIFSYLTALRDDLPEEEKSQYPRVETQLINRSYMDLYPREKLIYLSPDAREELGEIDNDSVYILGGIVDVDCMNTVGSPDAIEPRVTLAKAKKDGIKARRLPLDRYVKWEVGGRSLPLNTVLRILRDVYTLRGDWRTALLKNISQRCLKPLESRNQFIRQRHKGFQERTKDAVQLVRSSLGAERHDLLPSELREMEKQRKKSMRNRN